MRKFLPNHRFIAKLLLLTLPPLLMIIYLSTDKIIQMSARYDALKETSQSILISRQAASLIHELQIERGMSAAYLGSNGTQFADKLDTQRQKVDMQFKSLQILSSHNTLDSTISEANNLFNNITMIRNQVTARTISVQEEIDFYTRIITLYINNISFTAKASNDPFITYEITAYTSFLHAKERLGIIRAIGANTFAHHQFELGMHTRLAMIMAEKNLYLSYFSMHANDSLLTLYNQATATHSFKELDRLENMLIQSSDDATFNEDSELWFDLVTQKIDLLWQIQQTIETSMSAYINSELTKIRNIFLFNLALDVIMIAGMFIIALYISKQLYVDNNDQHELLSKQKEMLKMQEMIDKNVITSRTNLQGVITDVSEAFCHISGYTKEELIGQSHRIVRHTDMPFSLYEDLWRTIQANQTWTGEIKNSKKNGDSYWVKAVIAPFYDDNGTKIGYSAIRQDITDKKKIEEISITDGLTGIYNRRYFNDLFPKLLQSAKRNNHMMCFLMLDVDHFKLYNDHYGHQMGDNVLIQIANVLNESAKRGDDFAFRLGGEEFALIYQADDQLRGLEFAQNLHQEIQKLQIPHEHNDASTFISVSSGLICSQPSELTNMNEMYKQADILLYTAKEKGRNQIVCNCG